MAAHVQYLYVFIKEFSKFGGRIRINIFSRSIPKFADELCEWNAKRIWYIYLAGLA